MFQKERKRTVLIGTDGEGEDFSLPKREGGAATDSIPGHIVCRCRSNRVQYYHTACCINRSSVFTSPAGRMEVRLNDDGAVSRRLF